MKILLAALAPILAATNALGANPAETGRAPIVLVHGAWETSSIWDGVVAKLQRDGYRVQVVTLPGRPGNTAAADQVSMESYRKAIAATIVKVREPVVLVGHSFAGGRRPSLDLIVPVAHDASGPADVNYALAHSDGVASLALLNSVDEASSRLC